MSEVVSIPQLRFPEFRDEWRVDKFVDLCKFQQGVQVDVELQSTEPKNNFLRFLRIENYTQKSNDFRYIPKELSSNKSITENEIAIVRYGATAGYIGRGLKGVLANNLFKLVLNKDTLDTDYLFHLLRSYKTFCFFQSEMSGGAMPALSFGIVGALKLPYSSISEQQKIAAFLTAVDNKIEQLSKKQELLGEYKKGLMQQIFSQAIRFKADDGSDFPDWKEKKLENVLKRTSTGLNPRQNFKLGYGENYYVTIKNISNGKLDFSKCERIDENAMTMIANRSDLSKGDLIMSSIGNVGESYLLDKEPENWNINESVFMLRASELMLPQFLYFIITNEQSKWYLESNSTGSSFKSIKLGELKLLPLGLPSLEEQTKIANFLSSIDTKIEQVGKQLDESKQFKKALLQQMFV